MRKILPVLFLIAGCGSSWQIRKGEALEYGCALKDFYPDADADGWGDAAVEAIPSCDPPQDGTYAANGRDCDDGSAAITGRVGAICPDALVAAPALDFGGVVFDESEFVFVHGVDTPSARYAMATTSCERWAGSELVDDVWAVRGTLATFNSEAELAEVQGEIEAAVAGGELGVYAGFVGIGWDGDLDAGQWSWVDDSADGLIDRIPWCDGEPRPEDFFPNLNPDDPEHRPGIEEQLPHVRLALVLRESGSWCLGMPRHAVPADVLDAIEAGTADLEDPYTAAMASFTWTDGHFVCERAKPDPAAYQELSSSAAEASE